MADAQKQTAPVAAEASRTDRDLLQEILDAQKPLTPTKLSMETIEGFEAIQRAARLLSASSLVPDIYKANLPNCTIAMNMASRLGADPLMIMQNLYIVHGRPGWSSQFYISAFNSCGRFTPIHYRFTGEKGKDSWGCVAWAKERETGEIVEGPEVTIAISKAEEWYGRKGSKWQTMPQLMLSYRAASFLVRTVAPELTMGLKTVEEIRDGDVGEEESAATSPIAVPEPASGATTTERVKAKLSGRPQPKSPPADEPPDGRAAAIAQIRKDLVDRLGTNHLVAGWDAAARECAGGKTSDQWTASEVAAVAEYLSTWRPLEVQDYADEPEPGSEG